MAWGHGKVTLKIHLPRSCLGSLQGNHVQGVPDLTFCSKVLPAPSSFPWEHSRSPDSSPPSIGVYSAHTEFLAHSQRIPPLNTLDLINHHLDVAATPVEAVAWMLPRKYQAPSGKMKCTNQWEEGDCQGEAREIPTCERPLQGAASLASPPTCQGPVGPWAPACW